MNDLYEKNGDREERSLQETRMFKEEMNIAEYPITQYPMQKISLRV